MRQIFHGPAHRISSHVGYFFGAAMKEFVGRTFDPLGPHIALYIQRRPPYFIQKPNEV